MKKITIYIFIYFNILTLNCDYMNKDNIIIIIIIIIIEDIIILNIS